MADQTGSSVAQAILNFVIGGIYKKPSQHSIRPFPETLDGGAGHWSRGFWHPIADLFSCWGVVKHSFIHGLVVGVPDPSVDMGMEIVQPPPPPFH